MLDNNWACWVRVCPNCNEITSFNTEADKVEKELRGSVNCGLCYTSSPASGSFRPYKDYACYPQFNRYTAKNNG